ncbi:hypothetical protein K0U27_03820 [archaeon]|nr:hypothetical protein [archaeon]
MREDCRKDSYSRLLRGKDSLKARVAILEKEPLVKEIVSAQLAILGTYLFICHTLFCLIIPRIRGKFKSARITPEYLKIFLMYVSYGIACIVSMNCEAVAFAFWTCTAFFTVCHWTKVSLHLF